MDGVHPNAKGYAVMEPLAQAAIDRDSGEVNSNREETNGMMILTLDGFSATVACIMATGVAQVPQPADLRQRLRSRLRQRLLPILQRDRCDAGEAGRLAAAGAVRDGECGAAGAVRRVRSGWCFMATRLRMRGRRRPDTGEFFPGKPYVDRGISGQTTPQMVVRFRQDVINLKPAAVVILAGTNDVAGNTGPMTPEMTEDNFRSMLAIARANNIKLVVSSILPADHYNWKPGAEPAEQIRAMNVRLKALCEREHLVYLDYYSEMTNAKGGLDPELAADGVHPTAKGYAMMAPLAEKAIAEALAK